jgi:hypothetical protein
MKKKPTQKEVVKQMLINNENVCGSTAYLATKKQCGVGTLNLHKQLSALRNEGYVITCKWMGEGQHTFKQHFLDLKKTNKKLLNPK